MKIWDIFNEFIYIYIYIYIYSVFNPRIYVILKLGFLDSPPGYASVVSPSLAPNINPSTLTPAGHTCM